MARTTERRITHTELLRVSIPCKQCGAEMQIDLGQGKQRQEVLAKGKVPACPLCRSLYDTKIKEALEALVAWCDLLASLKTEVCFHVPDEDEVPSD